MCICQIGYSGINCEDFVCDGVTCSGNGVCELNDVTGKTNCVCEAGFEGPDCADGVCFNHQCDNVNGVCRPVGRGYTCDCKNEYSGIFCQNPPPEETTIVLDTTKLEEETTNELTTNEETTNINTQEMTTLTPENSGVSISLSICLIFFLKLLI